MKEAGLILLQTIPATIDIDVFKTDLLKSFTEIMNVHDLHVWQLTGSKYVSTAHIIFEDYKIYCRIMDDVVNYFHEQGITIVTIQPEFLCDCNATKRAITSRTNENCLMPCKDKMCHPKICCMPETVLAGLDSCANSPNHSDICSTTQVLQLSEMSSVGISENDTVLSCSSLNEISLSSPTKFSQNDVNSSQLEEISRTGWIQQSGDSSSECFEFTEVAKSDECDKDIDNKTESVPKL